MPDEPKPAEGGEEKKTKKKGKGKGKLPLILALVLVLGGGGFFAKTKMGHKAKPPPPKVVAIVPIDEMIVNLANTTSFLKCQFAFGVADAKYAKEAEEKMPAIKDAIVMTLTSKSTQDVKDLAGKEKIKSEIKDALNTILGEHEPGADNQSEEHAKTLKSTEDGSGSYHPTGPVLEVYITSFAWM
jgi:flagellar FliL protein